MTAPRRYQVRVYAVWGEPYSVLATSHEEAAMGARDQFVRRHGGPENEKFWWTENFDSFTVEELEDPGDPADPADFVETASGKLRRYAPMDNPITATQFIEQVAAGDWAPEDIVEEAKKLAGGES